MRKILFVLVLVVAVLAGAVFVLDRLDLLTPIAANGTASMATALPACNGRELAEGFTYRFRDPHRGEIVAFHTSGSVADGTVRPDSHGGSLLTKRVIGVPGDTVTVHSRRVYVDGIKTDDIETAPFTAVKLDPHQYFVLGDNRSFSHDSREFGAVPRSAIFGRVILVWWPLKHVGAPGARGSGPPPGNVC